MLAAHSRFTNSHFLMM